MIVTCGKTINFLNLNDTNSRIVNFAPKLLNDEVELIMTPVQVSQEDNFLLWSLAWFFSPALKYTNQKYSPKFLLFFVVFLVLFIPFWIKFRVFHFMLY